MEPESLNLVQSQWFRWLVELLLCANFSLSKAMRLALNGLPIVVPTG